jgi:hypothetical protein
MAVYSVILPDSKILKRVAGLKSIVIVGCKLCANDSLAFDTDYPLGRFVVDKDTGNTTFLPIPIEEEVKRLKNLLESKGMSVGTETLGYAVCEISYQTESDISELAKLCAGTEAILSVSCVVGTLALKKQLGKALKIVPAMKTVGVFQICKVLDEAKEFLYLDKKQSTTIRFRE